MPNDELIAGLAAKIKAEAESAGLSQEIQLQRDFIKATCTAWFAALFEEFKKSTDALNDALSGSASSDAKIAATFSAANKAIQISKEDFPAVNAGMCISRDGLCIEFRMSSAFNRHANVYQSGGSWCFDVDADNNLFLKTTPQSQQKLTFNTHGDLVDFVMKAIFTVYSTLYYGGVVELCDSDSEGDPRRSIALQLSTRPMPKSCSILTSRGHSTWTSNGTVEPC